MGLSIEGHRLRNAALGAIMLVGLSVQSAFADPTGTWLDKDGCTLHIHPCGGALCGTIATLKPAHDPETGQAWTDKKNVDPIRRSRPLLGLQVLIAMRPNGPNKWSGQLYNVENGKTYSGNLIELSPGTIRVEGCVLGLCGGESLSRVGPAKPVVKLPAEASKAASLAPLPRGE